VGSGASVDAAGGAGFGDDDFAELREVWLEVLPDPGGDIFAGGVMEAGDFVQVAVVELVPDG